MKFIWEIVKDFFYSFEGCPEEMSEEELKIRQHYIDGKTFFENKEYDKALESFKIFNSYETNGRALFYMAEIYFIKKDFNNAIIHYEKTIPHSNTPHHYWGSYIGISCCYIEKKELDKAKKYCQKILKENPSLPFANNTMGTIYKLTNNYQLAIEHYKEAIKNIALQPDSYMDPWFNLLELYFELQDTKNASGLTKKMSSQVAGKFIEENTEIEYWEKEHLERIEGYIIKAIDINKNDSGLYLDLGKIYYGKKEYNKAIEILSRAVSIEPDNAQINAFLGFSYTRDKKFETAIEHINKAISIDPDEKKFYNLLGRTYFLKHEYDKAFNCFEKSLERSIKHKTDLIDTYDGFAYRAMGYCCYKKDNYKEAIRYYLIAFDKSERSENNKIEAYNALIRLYYQLKDYDNTMKIIRMAESIQPGAYYESYFEKIYNRDNNDVIALFFLSLYFLRNLEFKVDLSVEHRSARHLSSEESKSIIELKEKIIMYLNKVKQNAPELASEADKSLEKLELVWSRNKFKGQ